ncbi:MAG TPA: Gfo/Idh/MocA family oxidoreductase [Tepidisphaeraceae bacterium]|nr:Gfo/Idh/MocA family oxidoreductase [Tepidisphaeraceae bacterium]
MPKQWKCAVVGTGVVGEWHVRLIPKLPNCSLVAACDVLPEKAKATLDRNNVTGVPVYADVRELLRAHPDLDVVHVCTPSGDHMNPVVTALEAGKNVICEKPLEIALDRIDAMIAASKASGARLAAIFQNRWNDANRAIKAAVDENRFGQLAWAGCFTPWYRPDKYYDEGGWRGTWRLDGGGAIMNQSVHAIDLLQWVVGPVRSVSAYAAFQPAERIHKQIEVEDICSVALQFENGAFGTIMGTTGMFPGQPPRLEIGGSTGTAVSEAGLKMFHFADPRPADQDLLDRLAPPPPDFVKKKLVAHGGDALFNSLNFNKPGGTAGGSSNRDVGTDFHARNILHILGAWEEGRDAETSGPEARKAVAIILAIYESARRGGAPVSVSG